MGSSLRPRRKNSSKYPTRREPSFWSKAEPKDLLGILTLFIALASLFVATVTLDTQRINARAQEANVRFKEFELRSQLREKQLPFLLQLAPQVAQLERQVGDCDQYCNMLQEVARIYLPWANKTSEIASLTHRAFSRADETIEIIQKLLSAPRTDRAKGVVSQCLALIHDLSALKEKFENLFGAQYPSDGRSFESEMLRTMQEWKSTPGAHPDWDKETLGLHETSQEALISVRQFRATIEELLALPELSR